MALSEDAIAIAASNLTAVEITTRIANTTGKSHKDTVRDGVEEAYKHWAARLRSGMVSHADSPP